MEPQWKLGVVKGNLERSNPSEHEQQLLPKISKTGKVIDGCS